MTSSLARHDPGGEAIKPDLLYAALTATAYYALRAPIPGCPAIQPHLHVKDMNPSWKRSSAGYFCFAILSNTWLRKISLKMGLERKINPGPGIDLERPGRPSGKTTLSFGLGMNS
jgi:hypothetical protein